MPEPVFGTAELIADGLAVDWGHVERAAATEAERKIVAQLAIVARIADEHRKLHHLIPSFAARPGARGPVGIGSRWGHLELLDELGRGSYGTVYRAWDTHLHREVALKLFGPDEDAGVVVEEARRLARIRHPNVVTVHGADVFNGLPGLWMEFIRGERLDRRVREDAPFDAREAASIGAHVARALDAVHAAGLIHRDVKAQNVMRERDGRVVLMDLGASRRAIDPPASPRADLAGTPLYLAPELLRGAGASVASDLYSLGVLLFFLVSDEFPVYGRTLEIIRRLHRSGSRRSLGEIRSDLPAVYLDVVARLLDPDRATRPADAAVVAAALSRVERTYTPRGRAEAAVAGLRIGRRGWIAAAVLTAVVGASVWGSMRVTRHGAAMAVSLADVRSIAVLPVRNHTGSAANDYLAAGLTDVLVADLARVDRLSVPSSAASEAAQRVATSSAEVSRRLNVDWLLQGTITQAAGRVQMAVELIDPRTDRSVWGDTFDRPEGGAIGLQAEIARLVAAHFNLALTPETARGLSAPQVDPRAEDAYVRGLAELKSPEKQRVAAAIAYFQQAVGIEPRFADALASLALAEAREEGSLADAERQDVVADARARALDAMGIDPGSTQAYSALGVIQFYYDWDLAAADASLTHAIELSPRNASAIEDRAVVLGVLDRLPEAVRLMRQAVSLEPSVPVHRTTLAVTYYYARDYERAIHAAEDALAVDPGFPIGYFSLARTYSAMGRHQEAIANVNRAVTLMAQPNAAWIIEAARIYAAAGRHVESLALVARASAMRDADGRDPFSRDNLAYIAAAEGRIDDAFAILQQAVDERRPNTLWLPVDPRVDPLRADPRFPSLVERMAVNRPTKITDPR